MSNTVDTLLEAILPYDGPHTPQQITAATTAMAGLARRLANATRVGNALPTPADVDSFTGQLGQLLGSLPQVVAQVAARLEGMATAEDRLRTDGLRQGHDMSPLMTAMCGGEALAEAAEDLRRALVQVNRATGHIGRLYLADPD